MNLNKAMIIGNLTRDPEIKKTPSGQSVASFSIATSLAWTDQSGQRQEKTEFHNVVAWRKLADICGQYLKKGSKAYVEGRLQTQDWTAQDGVKRYRTEIVIENLIMLDPVKKREQQPEQAPVDDFIAGGEVEQRPDIGPGEDDINITNIPF